MLTKKFFLHIIYLIFISCNGQNKNEINKVKEMHNQEINIVQSVLESQIKEGYSQSNDVTDIKYVTFDNKSTKASLLIIKELLNNNNFKINIEEFNRKVNEIFSVTNIKDSINYIDKTNRCLAISEIKLNDPNGFRNIIIFDNINGFIADQYAIPELIDYKNKYPKIVSLENNLPESYKGKSGSEIFINKWNTKTDLIQERIFNQQVLVNRNKYLFNNEKTCFAWLSSNDQSFLESLVKTFGYTSDLDLLQWTIERTKFNQNNPNDYGSLFWTKQCNGNLKIHSNTFKILKKEFKPSNNSPLYSNTIKNIKNYIEYLGDLDESKKENITLEERVKIMANMVYFAEQYKYDPAFKDSDMMMGRLKFFLTSNEEKILKDNNYFNLPKFKEWYDDADYDLYIVDNCEYEGSCGPGNVPMTYEEYRKKYPKK